MTLCIKTYLGLLILIFSTLDNGSQKEGKQAPTKTQGYHAVRYPLQLSVL